MLEYFLSPAKLSGPFAPFGSGRGSSARSDPHWLRAYIGRYRERFELNGDRISDGNDRFTNEMQNALFEVA